MLFLNKSFPAEHVNSSILHPPSITKVGRLTASNYYSQPRHYHPTTEIILITKGNVHAEIEGQHYFCKKNQLLIYPHGQKHTDEFYSGSEGIENYYIRITDLQLHGLPENHLLPEGADPVISVGESCNALIHYFQTIYNECMFRRPGTSSIVNSALMCVLFTILRLSTQLQNQEPNIAQEICQRTMNYIATNYQLNINVNDIAEALNISYSHLNHVFTQEMKTTPAQYISFIRVLKARQQLLLSDMDPREIAQMVGYSRYSVFCRHFEKYTSVSPEEYRFSNDLTDSKVNWDHIDQNG